MKSVMKYALINALSTAGYIVLVAIVMFIGTEYAFGERDTILIHIAMLMLFVFSAAVTGLLVFGRPAVWYLNDKKKEALSLLFHTLGIFFVITIVVFIFMIVISRI